MKGSDLIDALKNGFSQKSELSDLLDIPEGQISGRNLSELLGISESTVSNLSSTDEVSVKQIINLLVSSNKAVLQSAIIPIVELYPVDKTFQEANYELFPCYDDNGKVLKYQKGLRDELMKYSGVFIFFDSSGKTIYVGRTEDQNLWKEMNNAFNRERDGVIKRVSHPSQNRDFVRCEDMNRQIKNSKIKFYEMTYYISAYKVSYSLISKVESLLIRSYANALTNIKMENLNVSNKP